MLTGRADTTGKRSSCQNRAKLRFLAVLCAALLLPAPVTAASLDAAYLYNLANSTGALPLEWVMLKVDDRQKEIYVCDPANRSVVIFNDQGMEVFRFGNDDRLGHMYDLTVLGDGGILVLTYEGHGQDGGPVLVRCNFRGEVENRVELPDLPDAPAGFRPSRLIRHGDSLYLVDLSRMLVMQTALDGRLQATHDLGTSLGLSRLEVENAGMGGFAIDSTGNFLFTVPVQFSAYRLGRDGKLESFGQPGSSPGRFGVVAGIAGDSRGNIYVIDTLRCVVMAFDSSFQFITEFGHRGSGPGGLVAPKEISIGGDDKLYVTQMGKRGVNVYRVTAG